MFSHLHSPEQRANLLLFFIGQGISKRQLIKILKKNDALPPKLQFSAKNWQEIAKTVAATGNLELLSAVLFFYNKSLIGNEWTNTLHWAEILYAAANYNDDTKSLDFLSSVLEIMPTKISLTHAMWQEILMQLITSAKTPATIKQFLDKHYVAKIPFHDVAWNSTVLCIVAMLDNTLLQLLLNDYFPKQFVVDNFHNIGMVSRDILIGNCKSIAQILKSASYQQMPIEIQDKYWFVFAINAVESENIDLYKEIMAYCTKHNLVKLYTGYQWKNIALANIRQFHHIIEAKPQHIILRERDWGDLLLAACKLSTQRRQIFDKILACASQQVDLFVSNHQLASILGTAIAADVELFKHIIKLYLEPNAPVTCWELVANQAIRADGIKGLFKFVHISIEYNFVNSIKLSPLIILAAYKYSKNIMQIIMGFGLSAWMAQQILNYADFLKFDMNLRHSDERLLRNILTRYNFQYSLLEVIEAEIIDAQMLNIILKYSNYSAWSMVVPTTIATAIQRNQFAALRALYTNHNTTSWHMSYVLEYQLQHHNSTSNSTDQLVNSLVKYITKKDGLVKDNPLKIIDDLVTKYAIDSTYAPYLKYSLLNNDYQQTSRHIINYFEEEAKILQKVTGKSINVTAIEHILHKHFINSENMLLIFIDQIIKCGKDIPCHKDTKYNIAALLTKRSLYHLVKSCNYLEATVSYLCQHDRQQIPSDIVWLLQSYVNFDAAETLTFKLPHLDHQIYKVAMDYQQAACTANNAKCVIL